MFIIKFCQSIDLNHGPLDSEATALPTEPPFFNLLVSFPPQSWTRVGRNLSFPDDRYVNKQFHFKLGVNCIFWKRLHLIILFVC